MCCVLLKKIFLGAWMAELVKCPTLGLRIVSASPALGSPRGSTAFSSSLSMEPMLKKNVFWFPENFRENTGSGSECLQSLPALEFLLDSTIPGELISQTVVHGPTESASLGGD